MNKSLNKLVTNKSFLNYPEGTQKFLIEEEIKENKKIAIDMAMKKFEDRLGEAATDAVVNLMNRKITEKVTTGFQPPI